MAEPLEWAAIGTAIYGAVASAASTVVSAETVGAVTAGATAVATGARYAHKFAHVVNNVHGPVAPLRPMDVRHPAEFAANVVKNVVSDVRGTISDFGHQGHSGATFAHNTSLIEMTPSNPWYGRLRSHIPVVHPGGYVTPITRDRASRWFSGLHPRWVTPRTPGASPPSPDTSPEMAHVGAPSVFGAVRPGESGAAHRARLYSAAGSASRARILGERSGARLRLLAAAHADAHVLGAHHSVSASQATVVGRVPAIQQPHAQGLHHTFGPPSGHKLLGVDTVALGLGTTSAMVYTRKRRHTKRRRKSTRRSTHARRVSGPRIGTYLPTQLKGPLGNSVRTSLTWAAQTQMTQGSPASAAYAHFNATSIFQPWVQDPGHQPMGYDQLNRFFNKYTVLGCTMNVTIMSMIPAGAPPPVGIAGLAGLRIVEDNTVGSVASFTEVERGAGYFGVMAATDAGPSVLSFTHQIDVAKWKHITQGALLADDAHNVSFAQSPLDELYFRLWAAPLQPVAQSVDYNIVVRLTYDVVLRDPVPLAGS